VRDAGHRQLPRQNDDVGDVGNDAEQTHSEAEVAMNASVVQTEEHEEGQLAVRRRCIGRAEPLVVGPVHGDGGEKTKVTEVDD
jgi:hypothetical protein